jgi:hypothetical protein
VTDPLLDAIAAVSDKSPQIKRALGLAAQRIIALEKAPAPPPTPPPRPPGALVWDTFPTPPPLAGWASEPAGWSPELFAGANPGLDLIVTPTSGGPNPRSELTSAYRNDVQASQGVERWYRVVVTFPDPGYVPTRGEWNKYVEWHTGGPVQSAGGNSSTLEVVTDFTEPPLPVGQNPRLRMTLAAGNPSNPTYTYRDLGALRVNRPYDALWRFRWSTAADGIAEMWMDGAPVYSLTLPTLYALNGTPDAVGFGLYNYRLHDPLHTSRVRFSLAAVGPTRASVGA